VPSCLQRSIKFENCWKRARVMVRNLRSDLAYLYDNEIHIWIVQLDRSPSNDSWHLLSADEQNRAGRFRFDVDKARFANGRSALRRILGRYLGAPPESLRFRYNAHGKPELSESPQAIQFNVTHSRQIGLIALARNIPIGVDLEAVRNDLSIGDLSEGVLSRLELERFRATPPEAQQLEFFKTWVVKEAFLKAIGKGLSVAPNSLEADSLPAHLIDVYKGFVAAVATPNHLPSWECLIFRDLGTSTNPVQPIERNDICGR
jgi:4'-phosphopantetheinyl transferase